MTSKGPLWTGTAQHLYCGRKIRRNDGTSDVYAISTAYTLNPSYPRSSPCFVVRLDENGVPDYSCEEDLSEADIKEHFTLLDEFCEGTQHERWIPECLQRAQESNWHLYPGIASVEEWENLLHKQLKELVSCKDLKDDDVDLDALDELGEDAVGADDVDEDEDADDDDDDEGDFQQPSKRFRRRMPIAKRNMRVSAAEGEALPGTSAAAAAAAAATLPGTSAAAAAQMGPGAALGQPCWRLKGDEIMPGDSDDDEPVAPAGKLQVAPSGAGQQAAAAVAAPAAPEGQAADAAAAAPAAGVVLQDRDGYIQIFTGHWIPKDHCCGPGDVPLQQQGGEAEGEYPVQGILDVLDLGRGKGKGARYLVKWAGYELDIGSLEGVRSGAGAGHWMTAAQLRNNWYLQEFKDKLKAGQLQYLMGPLVLRHSSSCRRSSRVRRWSRQLAASSTARAGQGAGGPSTRRCSRGEKQQS